MTSLSQDALALLSILTQTQRCEGLPCEDRHPGLGHGAQAKGKATEVWQQGGERLGHAAREHAAQGRRLDRPRRQKNQPAARRRVFRFAAAHVGAEAVTRPPARPRHVQ
eukprot:5756891-Prymnesium_polylepis.1